MDKQVFATREETEDVKKKNAMLREIFLKRDEKTESRNHKMLEILFNEDVQV